MTIEAGTIFRDRLCAARQALLAREQEWRARLRPEPEFAEALTIAKHMEQAQKERHQHEEVCPECRRLELREVA